MFWLLPLLAAAPPDFDRDVKPLLVAHCIRCHGGERTRGELDVRSRAGLLKGGEGGPAVSPGSPEKSLLWVHLAADRMPPGKDKLTTAQKTIFRSWIEQGAPGPDDPAPALTLVTDKDRAFWSFRPPVRPTVPAAAGAAGPVDAFLLTALRARGLTFSPEADPRTLLRRVTFGLTGLPPTPEDVADFVGDKRPDAYERVVDRLLSSPAYGERWGRHWLDVAGYADSEGILDADYVRTAAWRYRDYVIRAMNADRPYDRFLQEQIAGDELTDYWTAHRTQPRLPPEVVEGITATGYLRCASDTSRPDFVSIKNAPGYYYQTLDDTLANVATSTMGLTLQCAKCHGHKFDPIPHSDYYRMQAIFMSGYRPSQWVPQVQRRLFEATAAEEAAANKHNAGIDAAVAEQRKKRAALIAALGKKLADERLAALPADVREGVRAALATPPAKRTAAQKALAAKYQATIGPAGPALEQAVAKRFVAEYAGAKQIDQAVAQLLAKKVTLPEVRAMYDLPGSVPTKVLRRGDYLNPGMEVQPGVLSVLTTPEPFKWTPPAKDARTSGRRLAFAKWLTQPNHPLTARVMVNRVWLHHFGEGIVRTPENFGRGGAAPTHPELLDWLATELVREGWSLKRLHRLIVTSAAYRQSSALNEAAKKVDPENKLLWRQRMRRLEAEPLRDAILAVSGTLDRTPFGPPVAVARTGEGEVVVGGPGAARRSVYVLTRRSTPLTILQLFDQPVIETNCTKRSTSTVASQALALLNSDFTAAQGAALAARATREQPDNPARRAVLLAYGRPPTEREAGVLAGFVATQTARYGGTPAAKERALADLCQMVLSANAFCYVD